MSHQLRNVDLSVAAVDAAAITDRAEAIYTLAGGGAQAAVAGIGLRLSVGSASGDDVLLQTPERPNGVEWIEASFTALLAGTQAGRRSEFGFIDGNSYAVVRIDDGVVKLVVKRNASTAEQVATVSETIDLTRVHLWAVRIRDRREAEFFVDGESLGSIQATTGVLLELFALRAGVRLTNPAAAVGSASMDLHKWVINVEQRAEPTRVGNPTSTALNLLVAKDEGGFLYDLHVTITTSSARYIMVFDKATDPVNGDTPVTRAYIGTGTFFLAEHLEESAHPNRFAKGIAVAISETSDTLTLPASAEGYFDVGYA